MHATRIGQPFFGIMAFFLCVSLLLGLSLHAAFGISPALMLAVVLLTPILLYILMLGTLAIGLLTRSRWRRPPPQSPPAFRPRPHNPPDDDGHGGWTGVREPRRPLPPKRGVHATVVRDEE